ncbi:hypothetical protein BJV82DRAFT_502883, partial [Fennellomyces sp. T-0311]
VASDTDTVDREVAAATASLALASPNYHPYTGSTSDKAKSGAVSERALESLQTEVTALSEQIDRLRRGMVEREERQRLMRWSWIRLIKSIAKHTVINSLVLLLVFMVLWRRKSPVALAIVSYIGPQIQEIMRYILRRIVFWKVTV